MLAPPPADQSKRKIVDVVSQMLPHTATARTGKQFVCRALETKMTIDGARLKHLGKDTAPLCENREDSSSLLCVQHEVRRARKLARRVRPSRQRTAGHNISKSASEGSLSGNPLPFAVGDR